MEEAGENPQVKGHTCAGGEGEGGAATRSVQGVDVDGVRSARFQPYGRISNYQSAGRERKAITMGLQQV